MFRNKFILRVYVVATKPGCSGQAEHAATTRGRTQARAPSASLGGGGAGTGSPDETEALTPNTCVSFHMLLDRKNYSNKKNCF